MKKILNIAIICQLFFAFTLSFPAGVLAKDAPLVPPTPEDIPFDHKELDKEMYDADDKTRDAVALNSGLVLTGALANALLFWGGCHAPSVAVAGISSVAFLIAQIVQMLEYSEAQRENLALIKKNVTEDKKRVQEQTLDAAISDVEGMRKLARARRDAGIAYALILASALGGAIAESFPIVAGAFTCYFSVVNQNYIKERIFAFLAKVVGIESASAGGAVRLLTALGLPAATITAVIATANVKAKILISPWTRVIAYGILITLQGFYISLMDDVIDTYTKRIDKLRELKSLITTSPGTKVDGGKPAPSANADGGKVVAPAGAAIAGTAAFADGTACASQAGDPDPSCQGPFLQVGPLNDRFVKLADPSTLAAMNDARNAVNASASGKHQSARAALGRLSQNKNALRASSRNLLDQLNKKLISEKKAPINFSQEAAKMYKDSKAALLKAIADTPGASLAQMGMGAVPAPLPDVLKEGDNTKEKQTAGSGIAAIAMPDFGQASGGAAAHSESSGEAPPSSEKINSEEAFKGKKLDMNDINKNKDASIFTVLTVRYKLSAYPRFFKKLEKTPAPAPAKP